MHFDTGDRTGRPERTHPYAPIAAMLDGFLSGALPKGYPEELGTAFYRSSTIQVTNGDNFKHILYFWLVGDEYTSEAIVPRISFSFGMDGHVTMAYTGKEGDSAMAPRKSGYVVEERNLKGLSADKALDLCIDLMVEKTSNNDAYPGYAAAIARRRPEITAQMERQGGILHDAFYREIRDWINRPVEPGEDPKAQSEARCARLGIVLKI